MSSRHWQVTGVSDLVRFFGALPPLVPPGSVLGLAEGTPDAMLRAFFDRVRSQAEPDISMHSSPDFRRAVFIPATPACLFELAALARTRAEPEIAIHLTVVTTEGPLLEWFDLPDDPIYIAPAVPESAVSRLAADAGGKHVLRDYGV
jgi:hypothetical protein